MSKHYLMYIAVLTVVCLWVSPAVCGQPDRAGTHVSEGVMSPDAVLRPAPMTSAADSIITEMVGEISGDSIYAFIEKLSGVVPVQFDYGEYSLPSRYTPCESSRRAAEFLKMCFEAYGYTVDMHYYALPKLHTVLVQPAGVSLMAGQWGHVFRTLDVSEWPRAKDGIVDLDEILYGCDFVSGDRYVVVGGGGTIVTSDDGGMSWTVRTSGVTDRIEDVAILPSGIGWAAGVTGTILYTTDGGASWSAQTSGVTESLRDIAAIGELTAVAVGDAGRIIRTVDGGLNWSTVGSGTTGNLTGVSFAGLVGWVAGSAGTIIKSTDGGQTWSPQTSGTTSNLKDICFADVNTGWAVGTDSEILVTGNGGTTWTSQTSPVSGMTLRAVFAVTASEVWIVGFDFGGGRAMRTTNGGATWEMRDTTVKGGTSNVEASKAGTTAPAEEIILAGHYDSIPSDCILAPGADDNGSGIGVIVEAARVMAGNGFERTVKFVCFSGEEQGLHGSEAYAGRAEDEGTQIVGVFNLDSVGWNDDHLRLFSDDYSGWLGDLAADMAAIYAPGLPAYHWYCPGCNWSDHYPFWVHGFNAIVGIEPWDPVPAHHHTVGDTTGVLDRALMADVTKISVSTIASAAGVDTTSAGIDVTGDTAVTHRLSKASPNPFGPTTTIEFSLAAPCRVKIQVFGPSGRLVRTLLDRSMAAGPHETTWSGTDEIGRRMSPGLYFYRIEAGAFAETAKLVLTR